MISFKPLFGLLFLGTVWAKVKFDCDPCIQRNGYNIQAILHGSSGDPFWQQMQGAMVQAAKDMNVDLGVSLWEGDDDAMASQIAAASRGANALIVSIPSLKVQTAVQAAIQGGTPVFGLESGYDLELPLSGFIGMDNELAGKTAAEQMTAAADDTTTKALFVLDVSHSAVAQEKRLDGFRAGMAPPVEVVQVHDASQARTSLESALEGCPFESILLGDGNDALVSETVSVLEAKSCTKVTVGTFGTSIAIHQAVSAGKLQFAVSQQAYLQGAMSVVHATLYVTTGKHLAPSSESTYGMVLSGPELITKDNAYTDTFQVCEADAF